jgi:hypothetical protein
MLIAATMGTTAEEPRHYSCPRLVVEGGRSLIHPVEAAPAVATTAAPLSSYLLPIFLLVVVALVLLLVTAQYPIQNKDEYTARTAEDRGEIVY